MSYLTYLILRYFHYICNMFIPKNINKRAEDLKRIQAKELADYEEFLKEFTNDLNDIKTKTSKGLEEQTFIDLIKNCTIKRDQTKYPYRIFLFNANENKFLFEYDFKHRFLWYTENIIRDIVKYKFNMSIQPYHEFIVEQFRKFFKIMPYVSNFNIINPIIID